MMATTRARALAPIFLVAAFALSGSPASAQKAGGTMTVEGTFKFTGGDGQYRGVTGGGTFKTVSKSETEVEATWNGAYELAKAQAG